MKKYAAHYLFPVVEKPIAKGIVKVDPSGLILEIVNPNRYLEEEAGMEFHNGIICPAFVNVYTEFEPDRFYRKFKALKEFESVRPARVSTEKDLLSWITAIQMKSNKLSLDQLIRIFTLDAALAISLDKELGSLKVGKRPGLMLISGMDYKTLRLNENSFLKRLV
jgi:cytosine/adenosine deaminase-related metal-dependent hydrolase